jgi:hypothetical protein
MFRLMLLSFALGGGAHAGTWVPVGEGDCPGRAVNGSAGEQPDPAFCTAAFSGKTALCYTRNCNPGCEYIDLPTPDCRGGAELADVYTCVAETRPEVAETRP